MKYIFYKVFINIVAYIMINYNIANVPRGTLANLLCDIFDFSYYITNFKKIYGSKIFTKINKDFSFDVTKRRIS